MQTLRQFQTEAIQALKESRYKGTVVLPTGEGKSRVAIEVVRNLAYTLSSVLVVVPKVNLKEQWKKEFEKFGVSHNKIDFECINSAHKLDRYYDLVIVDECHRTLSPVFRALYNNVKFNFLVCLTATEPRDEEYRKFLYSVAPLRYSKKLTDSLDAGSVSPYVVYNVPVPMAKETLTKYAAFNKQFNEGAIGLSRLRGYYPYLRDNFSSAFEIAKHFSKFPDDYPQGLVGVIEEVRKYSKFFWSGMTLRKQVLYDNSSKVATVKDIVNKWSRKKWIIFTKTISLASKISEQLPGSRVYHSKLKVAEKEQILEDYSSGKFTVLVSVDALNEGLNVNDVDAAVTVSGSSTELEQIQRLGRCIRKQPGKVALFINLYVPNSREEAWVRERTKSINPKWAKVQEIQI